MGILKTASTALGMTPGGMALGGLSVATQIFGAIKGAKENNKNQALINTQQSENEADYNNSANKSYLETNAAKDQVKVINDQAEKARKDVAGRSVITGASDEAQVAANSNIQKNTNNAMSNLSGQATAYQEGQKRMYYGRKDRLNAMQMQLNQNKANNAANMMGNAADLFSTVTYNSGMKDAPIPGNAAPAGRSPELTAKLNAIAQSTPKVHQPQKNTGQGYNYSDFGTY